MTTIEFANKFFFQWFFVRLTRCTNSEVIDFILTEVSMMPDGSHALGGKIGRSRTFQWYSFQGFIVPLTGWNNDFKFIGKRWLKRITKKKTR